MALPPANFVGRHALITGAGRGLGRGCALALAGVGATVTLLARSEDELRRVAAEVEEVGAVARFEAVDVTDATGLEAAIAAADEVEPLSVLVTAAGLNRTGPSKSYPATDFKTLLDVNVLGTFIACRAAGARMIAGGRGGRIVTMSSQMGAVGYPGRAAYCATKHAVNGLTKALAVEWAEHGVTVNAVAPTFVRTALTGAMLDDPDFAAEVDRRLPAGRLASVSEVASAVAYLASDDAASVTGHVMAVDGGWTAW